MYEAHALYIASPDKTKLLKKSISSLIKNGGIESKITAVINSNSSNQKMSLDGDVEIIEDENHFKDHPPTRWFLDQKSEVCLFFDYDILVKSSLKQLVEICRIEQKLCGVLVYDQPIQKDILISAFGDCGVEYKEDSATWVNGRKIPRCYNYGVLAVPKQIVEKVRSQLDTNIKILNETSKRLKSDDLAYFVGQVALSVTMRQLDISTKDMPLRYNFPDCIPELDRKFPIEKNNIVCYHMLTKKMPIQKFL
jgi:lipopolysaccharide biosynthesis glycosyltransferase